MIADVPVGLLYSGGIDSNLINDICQDDLVKVTGGFEGDYDVMHARKMRNYPILGFKSRFY